MYGTRKGVQDCMRKRVDASHWLHLLSVQKKKSVKLTLESVNASHTLAPLKSITPYIH